MNTKRCIIIGSSPDTDINVIKDNIRQDDFIACADGGHLYARQLGLIPHLIVGDFDSSDYPDSEKSRIISLPVRKDDTDTVSVVKECLTLGFDEFLLFGMTGGRFDHTLANISVLYHLALLGKKAAVIDDKSTTLVMCQGKTVICGKKNCGFGIFPYACNHIELSLTGFEYDLRCGVLTADYPVGVSNTFTSDSAEIDILSGNAVAVITQP